jgi:hypothetical protein
MSRARAAYLLKTDRGESAIKSLIQGLVELDQEVQIVVIPRYLEQASALRGSIIRR